MNQIGSDFFEFDKFVYNLGVKAFLDGNSTLPSVCIGPPFMDKDHHHIIIGNKNSFDSNNLQTLFCKSPNYCESEIHWLPKR